MEPALVVAGVGKRYRRYSPERPRTIHEAVLKGLRALGSRDHVWVLRGLDFAIERGRMVGVIGGNGAGKSTLLRLLGGVGRTDEGTITARGPISGLLSLGVGFHPDLTGRENVFISGVVGGLTRREVAERFDSIVDFSELHDSIDSPLRTYSSGMQMRLGFAVAIHSRPEILLIDEVLAVGDAAFQRKCLDRIDRFRADGRTIVVVSHDLDLVRDMCDEAILLGGGRLIEHGPSEQVVLHYLTRMDDETMRRTPEARPPRRTSSGVELRLRENRFGSLELEIEDVRLLGPGGFPAAVLDSSDPLRIEIDFHAAEPTRAPIFAVYLYSDDGRIRAEFSSEGSGLAPPTIRGRARVALELGQLALANGTYFVDVAAYPPTWAYAYEYHLRAHRIRVASGREEAERSRPAARWYVDLIDGADAPARPEGAAR